MTDLAINQNGNLLIDGRTNDFGVVRGYAFIKQTVYIAMVEMPPTLITSKQFKTIREIEEQIKNYLDNKIGVILPFSPNDIRFIINRREDESISIVLRLPSVDNVLRTESDIELKYELREGFQKQLTYDFVPNNILTPIEKEVMEIINLKESSNRVVLNYRYSGRGTIKFYEIDQEPQVNNLDIVITKEDNLRKYSLYNFIEDPDITIDNVRLVSGQQFLEQKVEQIGESPKYVTFTDGIPMIYFKEDIPSGTIINLNIDYSNSLTFSDSVELITKDDEFQTFGCKLFNNKYLTTLKAPLVAGRYKAIYWANIYYNGFYQ